MEDVQRLMIRYRMSDRIEICAKDISHLSKLEDIFMALTNQMLSIREQIELTKSAKLARKGVITLSDDWEVITAPEDPIPHYAYSAQDDRIRQRRAHKCNC